MGKLNMYHWFNFTTKIFKCGKLINNMLCPFPFLILGKQVKIILKLFYQVWLIFVYKKLLKQN